MWQVSEGGGRRQGGGGGRTGAEGLRRSQRRCGTVAAEVWAPRGPPGAGRGLRGRWSRAGGAHGFTLHSGRSCRGTPGPPGNRTGTRPAGAGGGGTHQCRSAPPGPPCPQLRPRPGPRTSHSLAVPPGGIRLQLHLPQTRASEDVAGNPFPGRPRLPVREQRDPTLRARGPGWATAGLGLGWGWTPLGSGLQSGVASGLTRFRLRRVLETTH